MNAPTSPAMGLLPEGLADRLPPHAEASARLVRAVLDCVALYGYQRVMPPLAEFEGTLLGRLQSVGAEDLLRATLPGHVVAGRAGKHGDQAGPVYDRRPDGRGVAVPDRGKRNQHGDGDERGDDADDVENCICKTLGPVVIPPGLALNLSNTRSNF